MTITIKNLAKVCDVSDYQMSKTLREAGINVLLNEASHLQAIHNWDNKILATDDVIDINFVKDAYESMR